MASVELGEAPAVNLLMVEGSFEDQIYELAGYIETLKKAEAGSLSTNVLQPLIEKEDKEGAIKELVGAAGSILMSAPEKEFIPAFNMLVHLIRTSAQLPTLLPPILQALGNPPKSPNGSALVISVLTTIFNVLPATSKLRLTTFHVILKVSSNSGTFESLLPQLKNLDQWLEQWEASPEEKREVLVAVANTAEEAGDDDQVFLYLLQALQSFPFADATSDAAVEIANRLVKLTISRPSLLSFDELSALDTIQHLSKTNPEAYALLEVFAGGELEDFEEFCDEHEGWIEENGYDYDALLRKIRLLTLASLASGTPDRSLPYKQISKSLRIAPEEVELWVIDVIRAGLVEGKLSQLNQTFLIHRSTYRAFGEKQWKEVADRLEGWRSSLKGILEVLSAARQNFEQHGAEGPQQQGFSGARRGAHRQVEVADG